MDEKKLAQMVDRDPTVIKSYMGFTQQGTSELLTPTARLAAIKQKIPLVLDRINLAHDWDFNTNTLDLTTVANQGIYRCEQDKKKARDIITVLYGIDEASVRPLDEFSTVDADDMQYKVGLGDVCIWKEAPRSDDIAHFELVATPTLSGQWITVRYRLDTPAIIDFPGTFDLLLFKALLAMVVPRFYEDGYRDELSVMAARHQGKGREYKRVRQDPDVDAANVYYNQTRGQY